MTAKEFKAWFDGFTEAMNGPPTKTQWARVKERVAEIDGTPVTERYYIDHYWPRYLPVAMPVWSAPLPTWPTLPVVGSNSARSTYAGSNQTQNFCSMNAMHALGKHECDARAW